MRGVAAAIAFTVAVGLVIQLHLLLTGGADANSGDTGSLIPIGTRLVRLFSYFTIDSNFLVLLLTLRTAISGAPSGAVWRVVRLDALLSIAVTGSIFTLLLDPTIRLRDAATIVNTLFHIAVPIAFTGWWLIWGPRRTLNARTILWAFAWPLAWLSYTFIRGAVTGWYPYPVLDAGSIGLWAALSAAAAVLGLAALMAAAALAIDRFLPALPWRAPDDKPTTGRQDPDIDPR